eukprot:9449416-Alexandrium_andersonii.AAC.1
MDEHRGDAFLPVSVVSHFQALTDKLLRGYSWLASECDKKSLLLFNLVPKLHWFWHMAARA